MPTAEMLVAREMPITKEMLVGAAIRPTTAAVSPGPDPGTWTIKFHINDSAGALAATAGALALARLDIFSALISRASVSGVPEVSFDVRPLGETRSAPIDAEELATSAEQILRGEKNMVAEIAKLRQEFPVKASVSPKVDLDLGSELSTGIKVVCADRPALVYNITEILGRHRLHTRAFSILMFRGCAHASFRIVDSTGVPPKNSLVLGALRAELLSNCSF